MVLAVVRLTNRALARVARDTDSRYRIRKLVVFCGYAAILMIVGAVFSDKFGAFTVAFGVAGAGIAFALQEVIDIGVLRTTVMECGDWISGDLYNGRIVRLPNSLVFKEPVRNYSADFPFLWDEITVPIRHGSDRVATRKLLLDAVTPVVSDFVLIAHQSWPGMVAKYRIEDATVEPMVTMVADENWMTFTIRYVVDYRSRRLTRDRITTRVLDGIDASGGAVSIASAAFEVTNMTPVSVRITGAGQASG